MTSPLQMYSDGLRAGSDAHASHVRLSDGSFFPLALERYLGPADAVDEQLLDGVLGPVLDVGCGPGRHLHALAARGVFALGVDLSPVAVELAVGRGGRAIVGDIFCELPGDGTWRSALLLDGNIGIGGAPARLLARVRSLLHDHGELLVELDPPSMGTCHTYARIEAGGVASAWFRWARVSAPDFAAVARAGGLIAEEPWPLAGRWFSRCRPSGRPVAHRERLMARAVPEPTAGPPAPPRYGDLVGPTGTFH